MSGVQEVVFETVDIKGQWFAALQDLDPSVREALKKNLLQSEGLKDLVGPFEDIKDPCFVGVLALHLNAVAEKSQSTVRFGGTGIPLKRGRTPKRAVS